MVLLSLDIEEFDMPLEYKGKISFEEQLSISKNGTEIILDILKKHNIKATFFSTVVFAKNNQETIKRLLKEGHELASHTWFHSKFELEDLQKSKLELEKIFGEKIYGLRMPRMMNIDENEVAKAGYFYNSSINPTYLPGRYNNLHISRTEYMQGGVLQIPTSVSPNFRVPLFWLTFHNIPLSWYQKIFEETYRKDGYVNIYFHPWEFVDIKKKEYNLPFYTTRTTGNEMIKKFEKFLTWINKNDFPCNTLKEFAEAKNLSD